MRIAAYCRVSTEKDAQLDSLENQIRFFDDFAQKYQHTLVKVYTDEGISGKQIKNRREFIQMLEDAKLGMFDKVVVKDISRFARNTVDFLTSIRELRAIDVEVEFLSNNQTILGNSEFILTIFSAMAQEESANLSKRVKFGKAINAKKGRVPNFVYGYEKLDTFHLTINPQESAVVRQIFDYYLNDGYGANKIANELNTKGLKTKRGAPWSQNAVCRILSNQLYTGKIINKKSEVKDFISGRRDMLPQEDWIVIERPEYRIISDKDFAQVQKILAGRQAEFKLNAKRQSGKHIFSTLIRCGYCGYSFRRFERTYVNTTTRWLCSGRNAFGTGSCQNNIKIDETSLLEAIQDYFTSLVSDQDKLVLDTVKYVEQIRQARQARAPDAKTLAAEVEKLNKLRNKYIIMFENEIITMDELKQKNDELNSCIHKYESELSLAGKSEKEQEVLLGISQILSTKNFTNVLLKKIIDTIIVNPDGGVWVELKQLGCEEM